MLRAVPASFDAFYPAFDAPVHATLNSGLLYLEIFSVLVNAVIGRSDRDRRQGRDRHFDGPERRRGIERRKRP